MFSYFGSKARLASTYQAPRHDVIVEPFAGAAGYSMYWLTRRPDAWAILIDHDPWVAAVWHRLLSLEPTDLWDYPIPERGETTDPLYLAASVSMGPGARWAREGSYVVTEWMAAKFPSARRQWADTLSRIRGRVTFHHATYDTAPDIEATWFIDPPYQQEGHRYDSGNALDFVALSEWAQERTGQVIVCESSGADWMPFEPHATTQTVGGGRSTEVVWYSHPEPNLFTT